MLIKRFEITGEEATQFQHKRPTLIEIHDKYLYYNEYFVENYQDENEITGEKENFENKTYVKGALRKEDIHSIRVTYTSEIGCWAIAVFSHSIMTIFTVHKKSQADEIANAIFKWVIGEDLPGIKKV